MATKKKNAIEVDKNRLFLNEDGEYEMKVKIYYFSPVLGTSPMNKALYATFVGKNCPDKATLADEIEHLGAEQAFENALTGFLRLPDGTPCAKCHTWGGFFKESATQERRGENSICKDWTSHKSVINGSIFIRPVYIPFKNINSNMTIFQRPLKAETAQGPRICLAASEMIPAGCTQEFVIAFENSQWKPYLEKCLNRGKNHGTYQYRNGGYGRFLWQEIHPITGEQIGGNYTPEKYQEKYDEANAVLEETDMMSVFSKYYDINETEANKARK